VKSSLNTCSTLTEETNPDALSFVKLHSTLCFLMTQFHQHQSPKLAQFIVSHIRLVIEHPDVAAIDNCRSLYLQLLQQWQNITASLLSTRGGLPGDGKLAH
jgi:hypothetical protein